MVPVCGRNNLGVIELRGGSVQPPYFLPAGCVHRIDQRSLDVQDPSADLGREENNMTTLAFAGFFGSVFGIAILCAASFVAGVIFKNPFLKLVTGGKWQG